MSHNTWPLSTLLLLLLGGCSLKQPDPSIEMDATPGPIQSEQVDSETVKKPQPEITEPQPAETPKQEIIIQPFTENGFGRSIYDTPPYLPLGEPISVSNQGIEVGIVSVDGYEIVADELGSGRLGLVLWLTETNNSSEALEVGLYGVHTLSSLNVFYNDLELKRLSHGTPLEKIEGESYIQTYHVQFNPRNETAQACAESSTLQPKENRLCYQTYSYAGPGEYLISQVKDDQFSAYQNYLLEVN